MGPIVTIVAATCYARSHRSTFKLVFGEAGVDIPRLFVQCLVSYLADFPEHSASSDDGPGIALAMRWSAILRRWKR